MFAENINSQKNKDFYLQKEAEEKEEVKYIKIQFVNNRICFFLLCK